MKGMLVVLCVVLGLATAGSTVVFITGDSHVSGTSSPALDSVVAAMVATRPQPEFVIHCGDLVNHVDTANMIVALEAYASITNFASFVPLYPVMGNHDNNAAPLWGSFFPYLPGRMPWLKYSVRTATTAWHGHYYLQQARSGPQIREWFVSVLKADSALGIKNSFVWMHTPPFTSCSKSNRQDPWAEDLLVPVWEQYGVTAVFSGHVHSYERGKVRGVNYITAGGGGGPIGPYPWTYPQPEWSVVRDSSCHFFVKLTAYDDGKVATVGIRADGTEFDYVVLTDSIPEEPEEPEHGYLYELFQQLYDSLYYELYRELLDTLMR